jgi:hypothetical protein
MPKGPRVRALDSASAQEVCMFDSLDEQMAKDESKVISPRERIIRWLIYVIAAVLIFGGLIVGVRSLG